MKLSLFLFITCLASLPLLCLGDEPPKPQKTDDAKKTVKVKEETFELVVELDGIVESLVNTPIQVIPKAWADLSVLDYVEHGEQVKKGDVILRFETEKLAKEIEDLEAKLPLTRLRLEAAEKAYKQKKESLPLDLEKLRKTHDQLKDDYTYFVEVSRPLDERGAREILKSYRNYLAYSEEELKQLKKMYESDDLTEETEEIILKRAQDEVDRDRWRVEQSEISTERRLNTTIPRDFETRKRNLEIAEIEWKDAVTKAKRDLEIQEGELEEKERGLAKEEEKLSDLKSDLKALVVKAPHDGIVYYGASRKGRWVTAATIEKKLIPGGRAAPKEVLLTLVNPEKVQIRAAVPEDKLKELKVDQEAAASLKWNDDVKLDATVKSISYIPSAMATYDTVFSIDPTQTDAPLYPGMNTKIKIVAYQDDNAIVVPVHSVKKEGDKHFVTMKDGSKREVKVGKSNKDKQVILEGLKPGDEIEEGKPAEKK